ARYRTRNCSRPCAPRRCSPSKREITSSASCRRSSSARPRSSLPPRSSKPPAPRSPRFRLPRNPDQTPPPMPPKHFLDIDALDAETLRAIIDAAVAIKKKRKRGKAPKGPGEGAVLAMIFERPSTRTRVSFEVAMRELGGSSIVLDPQDMQLGRGETIADTARVLTRYCDAI